MRISLGGFSLVALLLTGCNQAPDGGSPSPHRGRYQGIGTYSAGPLWPHLKAENRRSDTAAANLDDDEQIIVVVDSQTGEVRQCGNLSGYCIRMNPWEGSSGQGQATPVPLTKHAADLDREADQRSLDEQAAIATNAAAAPVPPGPERR